VGVAFAIDLRENQKHEQFKIESPGFFLRSPGEDHLGVGGGRKTLEVQLMTSSALDWGLDVRAGRRSNECPIPFADAGGGLEFAPDGTRVALLP